MRPARGVLVDDREAPRPGFRPAIDVGGERCIVGIRNDEVPPDCALALSTYEAPTDPGRASIYRREGEHWVLQADLVPRDPTYPLGFGYAVAIHDRTAVVSSSRRSWAGRSEGEVHVFEEVEPDRWEQVLHVRAESANEFLGACVDVEDGLIVMGAPNDGSQISGAVYVLERREGLWTRAAKLMTPLATLEWASLNSDFGSTLDVCGALLVIGSQYESGPRRTQGAAYVYERQMDGEWALTQRLNPRDTDRHSFFGWEVCIAADDEIFVTTDHYGDPWRMLGFRRTRVGWIETQVIEWPGIAEDDLYGISLTAEGEHLFLGAPCAAGTDGASGVVHAYTRQLDGWQPTMAWSVPSDIGGERFGCALALDGMSLLAGIWRDEQRYGVIELRVP